MLIPVHNVGAIGLRRISDPQDIQELTAVATQAASRKVAHAAELLHGQRRLLAQGNQRQVGEDLERGPVLGPSALVAKGPKRPEHPPPCVVQVVHAG